MYQVWRPVTWNAEPGSEVERLEHRHVLRHGVEELLINALALGAMELGVGGVDQAVHFRIEVVRVVAAARRNTWDDK